MSGPGAPLPPAPPISRRQILARSRRAVPSTRGGGRAEQTQGYALTALWSLFNQTATYGSRALRYMASGGACATMRSHPVAVPGPLMEHISQC